MENDSYNVEQIRKQIDVLMKQFLGDEPDEKSLLILSQYLEINPTENIDVKALFKSIKRDNKIDNILGNTK